MNEAGEESATWRSQYHSMKMLGLCGRILPRMDPALLGVSGEARWRGYEIDRVVSRRPF